jgi:ribosomal protein S18 acetylase RimI-like enzyme
MTSAISIRAAREGDMGFLERMLALAASMNDDDESLATVRSDTSLRCYLEGFGRDGDLGVIAERAGDPIGAAWVRVLHGAPHPSKLWTREVPELAIATLPTARGQGVGAAMMRELVERARGSFPAIVLSVREGNPAVRLYERLGFQVTEKIVNRVGTVSLAMKLDLDPRP